MEKEKQYVGIDISREWMDAAWYEQEKVQHTKVSNNMEGYKELVRQCGSGNHYVMESTGPYYAGVALYLHKRGIAVSVVNALVIKRFIQMQLEKNKSDKKDALWICRYGMSQHPAQWQAPQEHIVRARQMLNAIALFTRQRTASINALDSLETMPVVSKESRQSLKRIIAQLEKEILGLEEKLQALLQEHEGAKLRALQTIPGIGKRAVAMMLIITDGFRKIENYRQLSCWAGLSPKEYSSGKCIRGKVHISKMGGRELRNILYMCSMNAIQHNKACKELYERLKAKGKNGKLALSAVSNKLIKQCVAIAKSEVPYDEKFISKKACF